MPKEKRAGKREVEWCVNCIRRDVTELPRDRGNRHFLVSITGRELVMEASSKELPDNGVGMASFIGRD
jgi:hypothetical protein